MGLNFSSGIHLIDALNYNGSGHCGGAELKARVHRDPLH
jgi:hypothetical protein